MDSLLPRDAVEQLRQERPGLERGERPYEPDVDEFMLHYMAVVRAGFDLLGAPHFDRLSRLFSQIEEQYMPGGPPMSPVYDSIVTQHVLAEVPHGPANETPYTVLARLASIAPGRERLARVARALADSHLDLYRVRSAANVSAELERVRDAAALSVRLTGPFLRTGDLMLARVVPFEGGHFIADSPYLLAAPEAQWVAHLERVCSSETRAAHATPQASGKAPSSRAKLSPKQLARLRQQKKAATQSATPDAVVVRHFKYGRSERYWLDYIMNGYAGERRGIVQLAGVPDIPETLPHHADYDPELAVLGVSADDDEMATPEATERSSMPRLREALVQIAEREGIFVQAERELRSLYEAQGLEPCELYPAERFLFTAHCTLGARSAQGLTALEHFERERVVDAEQRELVDSLKRGWFSVFRLDRIHLDRGFEVLDVLRRRKLEISERSATRQAAIGDLLLGWVCEDDSGALTLEGGVLHVPSLLAPAVVEMAKDLRDTARDWMRGTDFRQRAAELPPALLVGTRLMRERGPNVRLQNMSGHDLQLATGRYTIRDGDKVAAALETQFERLEDGAYAWFDDARTLLASIELSGSILRIRVNSLERLQEAKARLEALLGAAIAPSLDVLEGDIATTLQARALSERSNPPLELPPELAQQLHGMLLERIRANFDEPIAMFKGKTLRQLARTEKTRPDAISWLREQERILSSNPQMKGLDLRPLWNELGLAYQGESGAGARRDA